MKTLLKDLFVVCCVIAMAFAIAYLVISNNIGLFVSNGTYSLFEFMDEMNRYFEFKRLWLDITESILVLTVGLGIMNLIWNFKISK